MSSDCLGSWRIVVPPDGLIVRNIPGGTRIAWLPGAVQACVDTINPVVKNGYTWVHIFSVPGHPQAIGGWCAADFLAEVPLPADAVITTRCGVNIDLDRPTFTPDALAPFGYARFVYNVSQGGKMRDLQSANIRYYERITALISHNITPIIILNHQTYGEGESAYNWDVMKDDTPATRQQWAQLTTTLASYCSSIAQMFANKVVYEIWNEPDQHSVASVYVPPVAYANMLDHCLTSIHAVAPDARVITAGLVSGNWLWWQRVYATMQQARQLAGVGLHPYGRGPQGKGAFESMGTTASLLDAYSQICDLPFWITEWGVLGDPSHSEPPNVDAADVANYISSFLSDVTNDGRVECAVYFALLDGMHNCYGLHDKQGNPKPAILAAFGSGCK